MIYNVPSKSLLARDRFVADVLYYFGWTIVHDVPAGDGRFVLQKNTPNPFNPETSIAYTMARQGHLSVKIFDLRGHRVRTLIDGAVPAGDGQAVWVGID